MACVIYLQDERRSVRDAFDDGGMYDFPVPHYGEYSDDYRAYAGDGTSATVSFVWRFVCARVPVPCRAFDVPQVSGKQVVGSA